jgi:hypothetical protein
MEVSGLLSGGAAVIQHYMVEETFANVGVPALIAANTTAGVDLPSTTGAADMVGITVDTATYNTAQSATADPAERLGVIVNPDAIIKARWAGSGTTGVALAPFTVVTADGAGTSVILDSSVASPDMEDGTIWGYSGANVGQYRKITATSSVTATVAIPFRHDIDVGDEFLIVNRFEADVAGVTLTGDFIELDASVAENTSGAAFRILKQLLGSKGEEGTTHSWAFMLSNDHAFGAGT